MVSKTGPDPGDDPIEKLERDLASEGAQLHLTLHEAAKYARRHYQTAWADAQCGRLKAHKNRGRWRVHRRDLAAWMLQPNSSLDS
ncbi:MAG: helix-turn-helix domain-containing protein [Planctomycetes bacterium]|nr:helix-turn-helix domain-containing protein [Planctomycetota bacterium]